MATESRINTVYEILSGDDSQDRACQSIPDEACTNVPRNYVLNVLNGSATKLAEQLAGPNLVLPWIFNVIGAPALLLGFLMPVRQTGSLLPQMVVSGQIRRFPRRKWFWAGAGVVQAIMLMLMIPAIIFFPPLYAGLAVIGLLALFSMASGVGSVAFQDVAGKTIPKGRRGRLLANRATIGGILTIAAGIILRFWIGNSTDYHIYLILIFIAAVLWLAGALFFSRIKELAGATGGGRNAILEARAGIKNVRKFPGYRRFLLTRLALLSIEIATPFYVLHAQKLLGNQLSSFGIFVIAVGISKVFSSPFWGKFADTSSRKVMIYAGLMGALTGAVAIGISLLLNVWHYAYIYAVVFLLIGFAEAGVRLGRKTFLIDATTEKVRATYVAFTNTIVGVFTLLSGLLGLIVQFISVDFLIGVFIFLGLLGAFSGLRMPEARNMLKQE
ncbi:MAG: MFS transporter [Calditrichia bacterium]